MLTEEGGLGWWQNGAWHALDRPDGWPRLDSFCLCPCQGRRRLDLDRLAAVSGAGPTGNSAKHDLGLHAPKEPAVDLLEDRQGRLWMVTDNSGIYCLKGTNLTAYSAAEGLPSEFMRCVIQDEAGDIWAGDWRGGIARFRDAALGAGASTERRSGIWCGASSPWTGRSGSAPMPAVCCVSRTARRRASRWSRGCPITAFSSCCRMAGVPSGAAPRTGCSACPWTS